MPIIAAAEGSGDIRLVWSPEATHGVILSGHWHRSHRTPEIDEQALREGSRKPSASIHRGVLQDPILEVHATGRDTRCDTARRRTVKDCS